jgi:hypothetical protein
MPDNPLSLPSHVAPSRKVKTWTLSSWDSLTRRGTVSKESVNNHPYECLSSLGLTDY